MSTSSKKLRTFFVGYWPFILIIVLSLPLLARLFKVGFWVSDDGLYHLYRVAELARYVQDGIFFPRWFGEFSFGYGAPVFVFYNPLSYYLALPAAPFGLLSATKFAMAMSLILSAFAMFCYARKHASWMNALLAALVYIYLPYRLVDLYYRAAFAEHVAFIWFPLILLTTDRLAAATLRERESKRLTEERWLIKHVLLDMVLLALMWAGLVLTHSFNALMFAPFFAIYLLWISLRLRSTRTMLYTFCSGVLTLGLTAFFWIPLMVESQFSGLGREGVSSGYGYRNHLTGISDLVGSLVYDYSTGALDPNYYYAIGVVPLILLITGLTVALYRLGWRKHSASRADPYATALPRDEVALFGALTALIALFMCTQAAQPTWDALAPMLSKMLYPWRYLSIATFGISISTLALPFEAIAGRYRERKKGAIMGIMFITGIVLLLGLAALPSLNPQQLAMANNDVSPENFWAFDREMGQVGSTWAGEFIPLGVTEQRWALGRGPVTPSAGPSIMAPTATLESVRPDWLTLTAEHNQAWTLRYHAFFFPGWQIRVDGSPVPTMASGDMGLVTAQIPAGSHRIDIRFEATLVRTLSKWITWLSFAVVCLLLILFVVRKYGRRWALWFSLIAIILLAVSAWGGPPPSKAYSQSAFTNLEDQALLIGAFQDQRSYRPGEQAQITLVWLALAQTDQTYKTFVHLLGTDGGVLAQHDGDPGGGFTPTTRWQPGEIILDRHEFTLPSDLPPGNYALKAGMYEFHEGIFRNLMADPPSPDQRINLEPIEIR